VLALNAEHIEGVEAPPLPPEQQPLEVWPPIGLQAADLAVEHASMRPDGMSDFPCELRPLLEGVPVTRDKLAAMPRTCASAS
jgi:hypothetical protein